MAECPICLTAVQVHPQSLQGIFVECPRCGTFHVNGLPAVTRHVFADLFANRPDFEVRRRRSNASHILRRQFRSTWSPVENTNAITQVTVEQMQQWRLDAPPPSPVEQVDELIRWIGNTQPVPEGWAFTNPHALAAYLGMLIHADQPMRPVDWLIQQCRPKDYFSFEKDRQKPQISFQLTLTGWDRFRELTNNPATLRTAFMAMKFGDAQLNTVVATCFRPAVRRTGFELRLLTDRQPAGSIDDQLRIALRSSRFVLADLTHANNGAYWEAGFAEGLGRPVIYTCSADAWEKQKTHFDTNHLATIIWRDDELAQAQDRLTNMIRATLPGEANLLDD